MINFQGKRKVIIVALILGFFLSYLNPLIVLAQDNIDTDQELQEISNNTYDEEQEATSEAIIDSDQEVEDVHQVIEEDLEEILSEDSDIGDVTPEENDQDQIVDEETEESKEDYSEEITEFETQSIEILQSQNPVLTYRAHVESIGWQGWAQSGSLSGTTGQGLRVEAFSLNIDHPNLGVEYRSRVQGSNSWTGWSQNGGTTGTTGERRHLEGLQVRLTGSEASNYDIYYRVHSRAFGWLDWARNGGSSGTNGYNYRIEAIEVQLIPKGSQAPGATSTPYQEITQPALTYQAHVQSIGWQSQVNGGQVAGTNGQGLRVEALRMNVNHFGLGIRYRSRVQNAQNWTGWATNSATTGTIEQARHLEAVQIELTGDMANHFDVYYRVHVQSIGWLGWARRGETAGTEGYNFRIEAIEVRVVPRMNHSINQSSPSFNRLTTPNVQYSAHVQSNGWMDSVSNGSTAGTSGLRRRMEALTISLNNTSISGGIEYRTHVQRDGWQTWKRDGNLAGTTSQQKRMEAIEIRLYGQLANYFDVYYRTHVESYGWLGWVNNGLPSGSEAMAKRVEAIQIELVPKGQGRVVNPDTGFRRPPLIYIDPGHGGSEPGAVSGGYREKDLNLQVARRLNTILKSKGYQTVMSRTNDTQVSLSNRAQEANRINSDIFVSIHFNAFRGTARGIETYYYNQNGSTSNPLANNPSRINNSRSLANAIHGNVLRKSGAVDRNVRTANFHVVRETFMPAVLLELGYIDHPGERALITQGSYQQILAQGVADGIDAYFGNWK